MLPLTTNVTCTPFGSLWSSLNENALLVVDPQVAVDVVDLVVAVRARLAADAGERDRVGVAAGRMLASVVDRLVRVLEEVVVLGRRVDVARAVARVLAEDVGRVRLGQLPGLAAERRSDL